MKDFITMAREAGLNGVARAGYEPELRRFAELVLADARTKQPVVPDVLTPEGESYDYTQGWNDCRAEMLRGAA